MSASAATLSPTCFITAMLRTPQAAAAAATSTATFSLVQYSKYRSLSLDIWKKLSDSSEDGVPG